MLLLGLLNSYFLEEDDYVNTASPRRTYDGASEAVAASDVNSAAALTNHGSESLFRKPLHDPSSGLLLSHPSDPCMGNFKSHLNVFIPPRPASSLELCSSTCLDVENLSLAADGFSQNPTYSESSSEVIPAIPPRPKVSFK